MKVKSLVGNDVTYFTRDLQPHSRLCRLENMYYYRALFYSNAAAQPCFELKMLHIKQTLPWSFCSNTGTAIVQFLVIGGCVDSFGVLFTTIQHKFDATATQIAWIPATLAFCYLITGN